MAANRPEYVPIQTFFASDEVRRRVEALRKEVLASRTVITETGTEFTDEFGMEFLLNTAFAAINGRRDLPEQKVHVQYLAQDQQLRIPHGLGISVNPEIPSEAAASADIMNKYHILGSKTYQELYNAISGDTPMAARRTAIAGWRAPVPARAAPRWTEANYYELEAGHVVTNNLEDMVFATICRMMKLNFDIRDIGALCSAGMRMTDYQWIDVTSITKARLTSKLKPYTMACLAGLNVTPCKGFHLGAWVRAFGVCAGILPSPDTRLNKEWIYTSAGITDADQRTTEISHNMFGVKLHPLCMNIIALFGLMHLNKNHTFITGDATMTRVGEAYIGTLRTMINPEQIEILKTNQEVVVRTAPHPFGLGQTYAVALIMKNADALTSPLRLRADVTPPLTQRMMIVRAAVREWMQMPIGLTMKELYAQALGILEEETRQVILSPPSYSELHSYYGVEAFSRVSEQAKEAHDGMMPCIYGYAQTFHCTGDTDRARDGLALAMSFENVLRDYKAAAMMYSTLWAKYFEQMETGGLQDFVKGAYEISSFAAA